ncbi:hypothetical protein MMC22_010942 [Lobaria immixta]|nr:hypothetical protein [Lobaria immixta]
MAQNDFASRRHDAVVFVAVSAASFAVAIMTAIARTTIKLYHQKRLHIDDAFLLLAVLCLCSAMGVIFISFPSMHLLEVFLIEIVSPELASNDIERAQHRSIQQSCLVLCLTTIFAVKFSFLFFFKTLTRRLRTVTLYWRVVSVITALAWVFGISIPFMPCKDCDGNSTRSYISRRGYASIGADIVTNLLIGAIPIYLIRQIQVDFRRKFAQRLSLCLSIMMISGFVISMVTFEYHSRYTVSGLWFVFWQLIEACVVVILESLTAFRLLFKSHASPREKVSPHSNRKSLWRRTGGWRGDEEHAGSEELQKLPSIPRATLTGMRTFIKGGGSEIEKGILT